MKQGEAKAFVIGIGAAVLREQSNSEKRPLPHLTIMQPYCIGYDGENHPIPANSLSLLHNDVFALYNALKEYYDGLTNPF